MPVGLYALMTALYGDSGFRPDGEDFAHWFAAGMIAYGAGVTAFINMPEAVAAARDRGILKRATGTPLPPGLYLAGRTVTVIWIALVTAALVLATGPVFFGLEVSLAGLVPAALVLALGTVTLGAFGLALASVVPDSKAMTAVGLAILLALSFFSDVFPVGGAPAWMDTVGSVFPLSTWRTAGRSPRSGRVVRVLDPRSGAPGLAGGRLDPGPPPVPVGPGYLPLSDLRMPGGSGTDLIGAAKRSFPGLRSVLLTAYADTDAGHHGHQRGRPRPLGAQALAPPGGPPLPGSRRASRGVARQPAAAGRWAAAGRRPLVAALAPAPRLPRPQPRGLPLRRGRDPGSGPARRCRPDSAALPLLVLEDGTALPDPPLAEVARTLALSGTPEVEFHDLVVVGTGPSGLAAAVYAGPEGLSTVVVQAEAPGGQAGLSARIENYLGFPGGVSGAELTRRLTHRPGVSAA